MRTSLVAQSVKKLPAVQETQVLSLGQEDPLEKGKAAHCSILPWRTPWQRSLVGYSPWGHKGLHNMWSCEAWATTCHVAWRAEKGGGCRKDKVHVQREVGGRGVQEEMERERAPEMGAPQVLGSILVVSLFCFREHDFWGLPGGSVVESLPISAGDAGLIWGLGSGLRHDEAWAPQLSSCASEPRTEPRSTAAGACEPPAPAQTRAATSKRALSTAEKRSARWPQLEKAGGRQQRPSAAKNKCIK